MTIQELFIALNKKDQNAKEKLFIHFMPFAEKLSREYIGFGLEEDDLIASAYEGLTIAINKFEEKYLTNYILRLELYIRRNIEKNILVEYGISYEKCSNHTRKKVITDIMNTLKVTKELTISLNRTPSIQEISEYTKNISYRNYLIDIILFRNYDNINSVIIDSPENEYIEKNDLEAFKELLFSVINNKKRTKVIYLYFFESLSLEEIGKIMNISKQAVYEIKKTSLTKIKKSKELMKVLTHEED